MTDKDVERRRYDERARSLRAASNRMLSIHGGSSAVALHLRDPYERYESWIAESVGPGSKVLEIGAGTGEFTGTALSSGAEVVATDISSASLDVLSDRYGEAEVALTVCVADMEALPFDDASFDCVTSAGSLSYGDNETVLFEIFRVLRPGGRFICVDSLNHNPIFRANRWIHFVRGRRSRSTLLRMPTTTLIDRYRETFGKVEVQFYGSLAWIMPVAVRFFGSNRARHLSNWFDCSFRVTRSAFKFVMVATKKTGNARS